MRKAEASQVLSKTSHNAFPVVGRDRIFLGLIQRSQLITLLLKKAFWNVDAGFAENSFYQLAKISDFLENYPRFPELADVSLTQHEMNSHVDLQPCTNRAQ